jgi:hypothetical protein
MLRVDAGSTSQEIVVVAPADCSPVAIATSNSEPVLQEPSEAVVAQEQQQPQNE